MLIAVKELLLRIRLRLAARRDRVQTARSETALLRVKIERTKAKILALERDQRFIASAHNRLDEDSRRQNEEQLDADFEPGRNALAALRSQLCELENALAEAENRERCPSRTNGT